MATGILSVGLDAAGLTIPSLIAFAAAVLWPPLAASFVPDVLRREHRWTTPADAPPALSAVAATTVLGARKCTLGWLWVAVAAWLILVGDLVVLTQRGN